MKKTIDVDFDFTSDSPGYWDGFWKRNNGLGAGGTDPDSASETLQEYHRILWSRKLPNGEWMKLKTGQGPNYLTWKDYRFGSDSIIVSFRYERNRELIEQVKHNIGDYKKYYESFLRRAYTIGGMIIFPKHPGSINQHRGRSRLIADRWDLTLECIRRFYLGQESPLKDALNEDRDFFGLFLDFKGYVDYFFLQDSVSEDYSSVNIWCGDSQFLKDGLPETVEEYFTFIDSELDFLDKRNKRIQYYCETFGI